MVDHNEPLKSYPSQPCPRPSSRIVDVMYCKSGWLCFPNGSLPFPPSGHTKNTCARNSWEKHRMRNGLKTLIPWKTRRDQEYNVHNRERPDAPSSCLAFTDQLITLHKTGLPTKEVRTEKGEKTGGGSSHSRGHVNRHTHKGRDFGPLTLSSNLHIFLPITRPWSA